MKDHIEKEEMNTIISYNSLEKAFKLERKMESKIMATRKHTIHNYKDGSVFSHSIPKPTRLTPQKLEEKRAKRDLLQL